VRAYNSALSFVSVGVYQPELPNGPPTFVIQGQVVPTIFALQLPQQLKITSVIKNELH